MGEIPPNLVTFCVPEKEFANYTNKSNTHVYVTWRSSRILLSFKHAPATLVHNPDSSQQSFFCVSETV
jgi:hypothetical protein